MTSGESDSNSRELCLRHFCYTKYLGAVNTMLTMEQKNCIQQTPFGWFKLLTHKVKISRKFLKELCTRWIERRGGFLIRSVFVPLSLLDVSIGLGLGVSREDVELESEHVDSYCRSLFICGIVKVNMVFDEVVKCHSHGRVDEFCKLYILLGLSEFLFPNRMRNVYSGLFNIVDNLGELHRFKWGTCVYTYLVKSLCKASRCIHSEQNSIVRVAGCVYLLQVNYKVLQNVNFQFYYV